MIRRHKWALLVSSLVILLPAFAGVVFWNRLPEQMTTHWGIDSVADGWSGRAFAVFGLPLMLLAVHWLCVLVTAWDKGNRNQSRKVSGMVLWIIPVISLYTGGIIYGSALGVGFSVERLTPLLMSVLFLVIGNYMPKSRQNRTIGIRIKWTLESEANWNATHRMAGKLWVAGGLLLLAAAFLPVNGSLWAVAAVVPVIVLVPVVYSALYARKHPVEADAPAEGQPEPAANRKGTVVSCLLAAVLLTGAAILCFTGNINVVYGETAFTVEGSYYTDLTVEYGAIDSVEFRETDTAGRRQFGFGTPRLRMGRFRNEEYGDYTRYSYTKCDAAVVMKAGEKTLVVGGIDREATWAIYEELSQRCE